MNLSKRDLFDFIIDNEHIIDKFFSFKKLIDEKKYALFDDNLLELIKNYMLFDPNIHTMVNACHYGWIGVVKYLMNIESDKYLDDIEISSVGSFESNIDIYLDPLKYVTQYGHYDIIRYILEHIEFDQKINNEILISACTYGKLKIVKYLVDECGADIHYYNEYPLQVATANGFLPIIEYLMEQGGNIHFNNGYPYICAVANGHLDVIKFLVKNNIGLDIDSALYVAAENGQLPIIEYLIENTTYSSHIYILKIATIYGQIDVVKYLLKTHTNPAIINDVVFINAVRYGHLNIIKYLVENYNIDISMDGDKALILAAKHRHIEVIQYLLANGANIRINNDEILFYAILYKNATVIRCLLNTKIADKKYYYYINEQINKNVDVYTKILYGVNLSSFLNTD